MTATKTVTEARITWTADHEQYFQGHGIAFTHYTDTATGCGETLREAFEDALESLAQDDIRLTAEQEAELLAEPGENLDVDIVEAHCPGSGRDADPDCAVCAGEWHFYVSIDVVLDGSEEEND